jgi:hypothetical protein
MKAAETTEGIERLGSVQYMTLPNSPQQNGKQEHFSIRCAKHVSPGARRDRMMAA